MTSGNVLDDAEDEDEGDEESLKIENDDFKVLYGDHLSGRFLPFV